MRRLSTNIEPNKAQAASLFDMLADFCRLCNAGLQQRMRLGSGKASPSAGTSGRVN
jgi:hypothetical protein